MTLLVLMCRETLITLTHTQSTPSVVIELNLWWVLDHPFALLISVNHAHYLITVTSRASQYFKDYNTQNSNAQYGNTKTEPGHMRQFRLPKINIQTISYTQMSNLNII